MRTRSLGQHHWHHVTREKKRCAHIDVDEFVVFLGAGIYEVLVVAHTSVVDEDVDATKCIGQPP